MQRYIRRTSLKDRRQALAGVRELLGDKLFSDFVVWALSENPGVSPTRYPSLVVLWLRGRTAGLPQEAPEEAGEGPGTA